MISLESDSTRSVFATDGIPNFDRFLGSMQAQTLT